MRTARFSPVVICILLLLAEAGAFRWHETHGAAPEPVVPSYHQSAPAGTFFMLQYASIPTERGVYGFEPGCEVHLVGVSADRETLRVSDGQQEITVRPAMLTNNVDRAEAARRRDQALQTAIAAYEERRRADYQASHRDLFIAHAQAAHDAEVARNHAAAIGGNHGTLDKPAEATQPGTAASSDTDGLANAVADPRYDKLMELVRDQKASRPSE